MYSGVWEWLSRIEKRRFLKLDEIVINFKFYCWYICKWLFYYIFWKKIKIIIEYFEKKFFDGIRDDYYIINKWVENDLEEVDFRCKNNLFYKYFFFYVSIYVIKWYLYLNLKIIF